MRLNRPLAFLRFLTAGGAPAVPVDDELALRRLVLACLLWEDNFYSDGQSVADRLVELVGRVKPETVAALAVEAREGQHLRHVPLLLTSALSRHAGGRLVEDLVARIIQRADELAELVAVHARLNGVAANAVKKKLPAAMKRGLARAFLKFDAYGLAKYDRKNAVKLRDVLFLCHAKPDSPEREALWKALIAGTLAVPDTWEVALSGGADKKATFERLIREGKLGYLALLRNLRTMAAMGCDDELVRAAIVARQGASRVLPFRYVAAAQTAPQFEPELDRALSASLAELPQLPGKTVLIVDVSGSMGGRLAAKSAMRRLDAAAALAALVAGQSQYAAIYATAGSDAHSIHATERLPTRTGMAMVDAVRQAALRLGGGGIFLTQALDYIAPLEMRRQPPDRVIVITDEQDTDRNPLKAPSKAVPFGRRNYLLNVAVERNGIGYKPNWVHIDGFSESVIRYIIASEQGQFA